MKKLLPGAVIVLAWACAASAAQPIALTTLQAIHSLSRVEARKGLPVAFEATVTYYSRSDVDLFVQDGGEAVYVLTQPNEDITPGDRVLVRGKTRDSFTPDVVSSSVTVLHHGALPAPVSADFRQMIRAERDCMLVKVRATVRSVDTVNFANMHGVYLKLLLDGGFIDAASPASDAGALKDLLDADVEVTGVVSGQFDSKMQLTGILLEVPSLADVKVLKRAESSPDSLPVTPMKDILSSYYVHDLTRRVRVHGTITYYQPGTAVVLQDGSQSVWISTHASNPLRIGDVADATGFPDARYSFLALTDGEIEDRNIFEPIKPESSNWRDLATWNSGDPNGHQNDLVSFEGVVVAAVREDSEDELVLSSDGKLFTALYRHPPASTQLPPMRQVPLGARIRVTGICMVVQASSIDPGEQQVPFNILLRSFDDVAVVAEPSWLNVENLVILVGVLLAIVFVVGARAWLLERNVRRQTAALAYIELRRSRILEDINGARPLAEIIEEITELVSVKLHGAPCWCQIAGGARLGNCPPKHAAFRLASGEIPGRSGPPLGVIYVAFDPLAKPHKDEAEALTVATALATLAIETRRLHSDLVRRSNFDLLTDIHNRFSLDKRLDEVIEEARQSACIFGLVYIDLDEFKQVNDLYGHQVGDLYLQEMTLRMKRQLRSGDMLARLGGDEFAALAPMVRSRADVEDVARRLERCFDAPFAVNGVILRGSASVGIAVYPEDGATRDSLLSTADAAMYVAKNTRRQTGDLSGLRTDADPPWRGSGLI